VSWSAREALEHAGIARRPYGGKTRCRLDDGRVLHRVPGYFGCQSRRIDALIPKGKTLHAVAVGRIAYLLGPRGPAMAGIGVIVLVGSGCIGVPERCVLGDPTGPGGEGQSSYCDRNPIAHGKWGNVVSRGR